MQGQGLLAKARQLMQPPRVEWRDDEALNRRTSRKVDGSWHSLEQTIRALKGQC